MIDVPSAYPVWDFLNTYDLLIEAIKDCRRTYSNAKSFRGIMSAEEAESLDELGEWLQSMPSESIDAAAESVNGFLNRLAAGEVEI